MEFIAFFDTKTKAIKCVAYGLPAFLLGAAFQIEILLFLGLFLVVNFPILFYRHGKAAVYLDGINLYSKGIFGFTKRINIAINNKALLENNRLIFITPSGNKWKFDGLWLSSSAERDIADFLYQKGVQIQL